VFLHDLLAATLAWFVAFLFRFNFGIPEKPQVDDLFKYDHLIDEVVDAFVLRGWHVPTTKDNKLDIESLMNRAYQENLLPEATYQKFENDMAGYFEDELRKKNTIKKQL
jgi:hypothetical protein